MVLIIAIEDKEIMNNVVKDNQMPGTSKVPGIYIYHWKM
jgi:hypothetical protein